MLPDVVFFLKNLRGEYVIINDTLVTRCGLSDKEELLGRTPEEVFAPPLGRSFRAQDRQLLQTGRPLLNQLELHLHANGESGWCLTTKMPLRDGKGAVIGLAGISRDLHPFRKDAQGYAGVAAVVDYLQAHLDEPITVGDLCEMSGLSSFQLDQRLRKIFHLSTGQLIRKIRLDAALAMLRSTSQTISAIAAGCGYCDQSSFTRQFKQTIGITPGEYRRSLPGSV